jgi:arylsulfatase A-like enzyme
VKTRTFLPSATLLLVPLLKSQGYRTARVGKWHLGFREGGYDKPLPGGR